MVGRNRYWILLLIFTLAGITVYATIIDSFFLSDDFKLISKISEKGPFGTWTVSEGGFFRPLISLSLFIDHKLWGLNSAGYHLTNIFIHSLNSFFVFLLSILLIGKIQFLEERRFSLSLASGIIFLVLPCHSEAVAWISGRTDLISTFFCLVSFYTYILYKKHFKLYYFVVSFLSFTGALFSKESAIIFPIVILLYEFHSYISEERSIYKPVPVRYLSLVYGLLLALYLIIRYIGIGTIIGGYGRNIHLNFDSDMISDNLLLYSIRAVLPPLRLGIDSIKSVFPRVVTAVAFSVLMIRFIKKRHIPEIFYFLIFAFIISLLPVINLGISAEDTQGERFIYLASAFSTVFVVLLVDYLLNNRNYFAVSLVCIVSVYLVFLYRSNENWRTAGEISENILDSLKTVEKTERLFIINLPDNIKGAYIYRNGIQEAVKLFAPSGRFKDIKVISYNNLYKKGDAVMASGKSNMYEIELANPGTSFMNANVHPGPALNSRDFEIVDFTPHRYNLRFKNFNSNDKLLFYSRGRMKTLKVQ